MADRLVVCGECSRHVKAFETQCPFCGCSLKAAHISTGEPYRRMAAAAAVAAAVSALTACGNGQSHTAFYGSPGVVEPPAGSGDDGSTDGAGGGATDGPPSVGTFYGIANPVPADDGSPGDGSGDGGGGPTDGSASATG